MKIPSPYVVFTGDASDFKQAKTAVGIAEWRPDLCVGQLEHFDFECLVDLKLERMTLNTAVTKGAKTLVVGYSPFERNLPASFYAVLEDAIACGLNIASGLHQKLNDTYLSGLASAKGVQIFDFRHRSIEYPKGTGEKRTGFRLLTVGTDCACGKKYTALSIRRDLSALGVPATFRPTGQTGFLIAGPEGRSINNDTIEADFLSGAAEWLSPDAAPGHWDVIEGQGSLHHPSFAGGSLSLLLGSQPDVIVVCHDPSREKHRGVNMALAGVHAEIQNNLLMARRTNPHVRVGAISIFGGSMSDAEVGTLCARLSDTYEIPVFDPSRTGAMYSDFLSYLASASERSRRNSRAVEELLDDQS